MNNKKQIRILHIDDDSAILDIAKQILNDLNDNFEIDTASCVDEAFKKLANGNYDIIISDYEMPEKNGLQFLKELRDGRSEIPFILFTGKGREEVAIKALNLGADAYINKNGNPGTVYGELSDALVKTIERKTSKRLHVESESKYRKLVENSLMGIAIIKNAPTRAVFANSAMGKIFGYSPDEMSDFSLEGISKTIHADDRQILFERIKNLFEGTEVESTCEFRGIRKDGSIAWVELCSTLIEYNGGLAVQGVFLDITERKKAEEKLKESEERFSKAFNCSSIPQVITRLDDFRFVDANESLLRLLGYRREELIGHSSAELNLLPPEQRDPTVEMAREKNSLQNLEINVQTKSGKIVTLLSSAEPIILNGQKHFIGTFIDITERKKIEEARSLSEARFRLLYENSFEGILFATRDGKNLAANNAACKMFGMNEEEIKNATRKDLVVDMERLERAVLERERTGKATSELTLRRKDGTTFEGEVTSTVFLDVDGTSKANIIIRDITSRKEREKEEKAKTDETRKVIDCIGDSLFVMDKNHVIIKVNKSTCDILKKSVEELIGKHCYEIVHGTDKPYPECPAEKTIHFKQVVTEEINDPNVGRPLLITTSPILDEEGEVSQVIHVAKDISKIKSAEMEMNAAASLIDAASDTILVHDIEGKIVYFNEASYKCRGYTANEFQALRVSDLEVPGDISDAESRIRMVMERGEAVFEALNLCKDKSVVPFEVHSRVIESEGKKLILSVARNISERKKAEKMLKEDSARIENMNEKLRVVGSLTRHDAKNKLSVVSGYAYLLKKKYGDHPDISEGLSKIEQAVAESEKIFEFSKMYEQLGVERLTYVNVGEALDEAVNLFSSLNFSVVNNCRDKSLLADSFLRQMFYNFIDNTKKYGEKATTIRVYCEQKKPGLTLLIYEDDGVGILKENKKKLFSKGFSTGCSTGFGLFFIKKMLDVYGWTITEEGDPGKGAKFVISLPTNH